MLFWILVGSVTGVLTVKKLKRILNSSCYDASDLDIIIFIICCLVSVSSFVVVISGYFVFVHFLNRYEYMSEVVSNANIMDGLIVDIYKVNEELIFMKASKEIWGSLCVYPNSIFDIPLIGVG